MERTLLSADFGIGVVVVRNGQFAGKKANTNVKGSGQECPLYQIGDSARRALRFPCVDRRPIRSVVPQWNET